MSNIWLTSDSHFNHDKDFIWKARGFENINEMNEAIVERWNSVVKPDDIVYHLGDVMMGADMQAGLRLVSRLNGIKYLAYGNHDSDNRIKSFAANHFFKDIQMGYRIKGPGKKLFIATHYPTLVANGDENKPIYSLHGHTHSKDKWSDVYHAYNVNVDAHDCKPVNLEDICLEIKKLGDK